MIIVNVTQGTDEWLEARRGVPTASCFDKIVTSKGEASKQADKYMYELAAERVTRMVKANFQSEAMVRGTQLEPEARSYYERPDVTGNQVQQVGFCLTDDRSVGCSPDGMVDITGLLEIKCPMPATHVEYLVAKKLPTKYIAQVQGQLYVTENTWCDFISYCPGLKHLLVRVKRDEVFIKKLVSELGKFNDKLDRLVEEVRDNTIVPEVKEERVF